MNRLWRLRALADLALIATLLAGAGTQHNHSLLSELLDSPASESRSDRFLKTHEDTSSSPLHWDRVLSVERESCVACRAQRNGDVAAVLQPGLILEAREEVTPSSFLAPVYFSRLPDSCRAPPSLL
jgi:hypothetical protein